MGKTWKNASINRSSTGYHSYDTNSFQTKFSKLNFPNFEGENPCGWIYKCDRFFKINGIGTKRR